jgi:hypothetical protein
MSERISERMERSKKEQKEGFKIGLKVVREIIDLLFELEQAFYGDFKYNEELDRAPDPKRFIEKAIHCLETVEKETKLIEIPDFTCYIMPEGTLETIRDIFVRKKPREIEYVLRERKGKHKCRYRNIKEVKEAIWNMPGPIRSSKSGHEILVMAALSALSEEYAWNMYLALSKFVDSFLW